MVKEITKIILENDDFKLKEDDTFILKENAGYYEDNRQCKYKLLRNGEWFASIDDKGHGWTTWSETDSRDITLKEDGTLIIGKLRHHIVVHEYINCDPAAYDYMPEEEFTKIRGNKVYAKVGNSYIDRALPF